MAGSTVGYPETGQDVPLHLLGAESRVREIFGDLVLIGFDVGKRAACAFVVFNIVGRILASWPVNIPALLFYQTQVFAWCENQRFLNVEILEILVARQQDVNSRKNCRR